VSHDCGLTYLGLFTPLSRWALRRIAIVYDAFLMPTMPPNPKDMQSTRRRPCAR